MLIKLTDGYNSEPIYVNTSRINYFQKSDRSCCKTYISIGNDCINVKESPEEVAELIRKNLVDEKGDVTL